MCVFGFSDQENRAARYRIQAAFRSCGFVFPSK
jgi:hypothetical protein